jgi:uncharacterized membrane protein YbhN (UPF0104 family)
LNKKLAWLLKLGFSLAVLGYLAWKAQQDDSFPQLLSHQKDWTLLAAGGFTLLATLVMQFLRWRLLVRALGLQLSPGESLRLGFMGQLFSLLGVGMLGGDALKTYYLGKHNHGHMTEALTTVLVDRIVGLYGLMLLAGVVCWFFDPATFQKRRMEQLPVQIEAVQSEVDALAKDAPADHLARKQLAKLRGEYRARWGVQMLAWLAPWAAIVTTVVLGILLLPGVTTWPAWDALAEIPKLGPLLERLVRSMRMYRRRLGSLVVTVLLTFVIHASNCVTFYFIAAGLPAPVERPSFLDQAAAVLLALAAGALPVGGLELIYDIIYRGVASPGMPENQGFLIVLAFRLLQMCIALIGLYFYLAGRREVNELMHEAQVGQASPPAGSTAGEDACPT